MAKWFVLELPGEEAQPLPTHQGSFLLLVGSVSSTDENPALTRRWLQHHGVDLRWSEFIPETPGGRFDRCLFPEPVAHSLLRLKRKDEAPVSVSLGYSVAGVRYLMQPEASTPDAIASPLTFTREELLTQAPLDEVTLLVLGMRGGRRGGLGL